MINYCKSSIIQSSTDISTFTSLLSSAGRQDHSLLAFESEDVNQSIYITRLLEECHPKTRRIPIIVFARARDVISSRHKLQAIL